MINGQAIEALLAQIEPWLGLLDAQSLAQTGGDLELRQAFFGELRNATQDFAQEAQKSSLRGLCNVAMLLLRGMDARINKPLDDDDIGQLTLWLSGVQSYLDSTLDDCSCLLTDLLMLSWVPKLAPAAVSTLQDRLREATAALAEFAQERAAAQARTNAAEVNTGIQALEVESSAFAALLLDDGEPQANSVNSIAAVPNLFASSNKSMEAFSPEPAPAPAEIELRATEPADTEFANSDAEGQIWIANEEFQLVTETVQSRLLPCLSELRKIQILRN